MAMPPKKKGLGVMIAIGRPKDAPMPPRGMKGAPGGDEPDMPDTPDEPDGDEGMDYTVYPETVGYHDDPHSCSNCGAFSGGQCKLLKMEVNPEGGCSAWQDSGGEEQAPDEGSGNGSDMDAGSGNGMMA